MGQGQSYGDLSYEGQDVGQTRTNQASYTPQHHQKLQHEQLSGQQKHFDKRSGVSALLTPELFQFLKQELSSTVHIIQNMIEEQNFDDGGRSYICQVMKDVEYRIVEFNESMSPNKPVQTQIKPDFELKKQHPKGDAKPFTDGDIDWFVIHSMEQPYTSDKAQSNSEKWKKGITVKKNLKGVQDLKQHLAICSRELDEEREKQVEAVSYIEHLKKKCNELEKEKNEIQMRNDSHQAQQGRGQEQSKQETHKKGTTGNTDQYIKELQLKVQNQEDEITHLIASNKSAMQLIDHLKGIEKELEGNLNALNHEKQALIQRLSKIPGKQLVDDNPETDDLSDPKRPQKLGVFYSELYDNEWTDAFDALTNSGYDDKEAIVTLRLTLINVLEFCDSKSSTLLKKTEEAVNFLFKEFRDFQEKKSQKHLTLKVSQSGQRLSDSSFDCGSDEYVDVRERWKTKKSYPEQAKEQQEPEVAQKSDVIVEKLKVFRKEVAESMVPIVQKAYISASWKNEYILELKPFIKKCIFLGWMMVVQSPPMCLTTCKEGGRFDKNTFKEFTKSGPTVDFVVLPALYLYENGPLIGKGVAEARK